MDCLRLARRNWRRRGGRGRTRFNRYLIVQKESRFEGQISEYAERECRGDDNVEA